MWGSTVDSLLHLKDKLQLTQLCQDLFKRLARLEKTTTMVEFIRVLHGVSFSQEELYMLNSPLLKQLYELRAIKPHGCFLAYSSREGHLEAVKFLIERKVKIANSSLHYASVNGHTEIVKLLLSHGPPMRILDALRCARAKGHIDTVQVLLDYINHSHDY